MLNQTVLRSAETLNILNVLGRARRRPQTKRIQHINISTESMRFFKKNKSHSFRGNVERIEFWRGMLNKNVLLAGEMLSMLNMLNVLGKSGDPPLSSSSPPPKKSTYSTFPLKEANFPEKVLLSS